MHLPELVFYEGSIEEFIQSLIDHNTLLVTDPYNYPLLKNYGQTVIVKNNFFNITHDDIKDFRYDKVIGIGGCSALDVGRAFAEGLKFIAIPTVLSTSCISVNISILRAKDKTRKIKTVIPDRTIIPLKAILETDEKDLKKWCASGFGDLFANISATIDYEYKKGSFSFENICHNAKVALDALEWVIESFQGYNKESIRRLAIYLHNSCLDVIKNGNNEFSAGCEHDFYETIIRQEKYSNQIQTHGILVTIGTLITVKVYEETTGQKYFLEKLKSACKKAGLPVYYKEFESIGITKENIINALNNLKNKNNIISDYFKEGNYSLLDSFL